MSSFGVQHLACKEGKGQGDFEQHAHWDEGDDTTWRSNVSIEPVPCLPLGDTSSQSQFSPRPGYLGQDEYW